MCLEHRTHRRAIGTVAMDEVDQRQRPCDGDPAMCVVDRV